MGIETHNSVGKISELQGDAHIIRADGTEESLTRGMDVFEGDTINTADGASINVTFSDDSNFAVSEDSSLVIDEYVYAPETEAGVSNFSMLKGMFVYTSGMIGREDPDDVNIETPVGSIGIRGTIIAGNVDSGEITVVEGAIVLKDFTGQEMTLASQFETGRFGQAGQGIDHVGNLSATEVLRNFDGVSDVSPDLFSSIHDAAAESPAQDQAPEGAEHNVEVIGEENIETLEVETTEDIPAEDTQALETQEEPMMLENPDIGDLNAQPAQGMPNMFARAMDLGYEAIYNAEGRVVGMRAPTVDALGAPVDPAVLQAQLIQQLFGTKPIHIDTLPEAFWTVSNQMTWGHNFSSEFKDIDSGDQLQYFLSQSTIDELSIAGVTGTLDPITGQINFDFTSVTSDADFGITVSAIDRAGKITSHTYDLDVSTLDGAAGDIQFTAGTNEILTGQQDIDVFGTNAVDDLTISNGADGNAAFLGGGHDIVNIDGDDNVVYLGAGNNTTTFGTNAEGNTAFGDGGQDTFEFDCLENQAYGFGGNDTFKIDIELFNDLQGDNGSFFKIIGDNHVGQGDKLELIKLGNLDFTQINNSYIKGIEVINIDNNQNNNIKLDIQDVLQMTDTQNTLRIDADSMDTFDLVGFSADATQNTFTYNAYTGGGVTVLVDNSATVI